MQYFIDTTSKLDKRIRSSKKYWETIIQKHESIASLEDKVKETIKNPICIRVSKEDSDVFLYYASYGKYFLCVVCRHLNGDGFIVTAYLTDKIKKGVVIYEAH